MNKIKIVGLACAISLSSSCASTYARGLVLPHDGCMNRSITHVLVELNMYGHSVKVARCKGTYFAKRSIRKQRDSLLSGVYKYKNKNNFVRARMFYLLNVGVTVGYSTTPNW